MTEMRFSSGFYRLAGVCSVLSAFTTLVLIYGSRLYVPPADFEAAVALRENDWYLFRLWVYFLHPFLVFTAAVGVFAGRMREATASAFLGLSAFFAWALLEATQQGFAIAALNQAWRTSYAATADEAAKQAYRTMIVGFQGMWDAFYMVLLTAFLLGNVAFAIATSRGEGMQRVVCVAFALGAGLTMMTWLANIVNVTIAGEMTGWMYPLMQPVARFLIGIWLFALAKKMVEPSAAVSVAKV